MIQTAPYGTWASPIAAETVARGATRLSLPVVSGETVYWIEGRPREGGRQVIVSRGPDGKVRDVTPPGTDVRSRVHEYGGGFYLVDGPDVYFTENSDQRLYRVPPDDVARPVTAAGPWRYADGDRHPTRRVVACVREDHSDAPAEPVNTLVLVPLDSAAGAGQVLVSGDDFYAYPRFSPDGMQLLWMSWCHPQMPWDGTELWVGDVRETDGGWIVTASRRVAGGVAESIVQPGWAPDGTIYFVSDRTGWWNLYRLRPGATPPDSADGDAVCPSDAEFARPFWQFGASTWAVLDENTLVVSHARRNHWRLATVDVVTGRLIEIDTPISPGPTLQLCGRRAVCIGHSSGRPDAVFAIDVDTGATEQLSRFASTPVDPTVVSAPESVVFETADGERAFAWFYAPRSAYFEAPTTERPPLMVVSHGGPTAAASTAFSLTLQYWTSRGFAVVDVDYRGSSGYGRAFRTRLNGQWGILDVSDCVRAAQHLVEQRLVDPTRLIIRGSSAGGFTTLCALTFYPGVFRAGASYFGISDLETLAADGHKFEARYLDSLVGPYPEQRDRYVQRSPIHAVDRLASALILFHGEEDRAVPINQAHLMVEAVRRRGLPVALLTFAGEAHGFRKVDTIRRCLEAELSFYGRALNFTPADDTEALQIDNV